MSMVYQRQQRVALETLACLLDKAKEREEERRGEIRALSFASLKTPEYNDKD